jgi:hypothetical protein
MKNAPYVLIFFLCAGVSYGQGSPPHPSPKQLVALKPSELEVKDLPHFTRYDYAKSPRDPFLDKSVTTTIMGAYKPSVIGKLVLLSWLNEAGQTVIYVQNTETNEVQKITSEPNKDNLRIVEIHPDADPKLFEAVISDGTEQGPVRFRLTPPKLNPQIQTTSTPAAQTKSPQIQTVRPPVPQKKN